jgi:chromosome partitioning protein
MARSKGTSFRSVAIISSKGGVGKTTLVLNLAGAAVSKGECVLVLDADPQRSCVAWAGSRNGDGLRVERIETAGVESRLKLAATEGFTRVYIDTAPRYSASLGALAQAVDYAVVPLRPSACDLAALDKSLSIVTDAGKPGCLVLNQCAARTAEVADAREALSGLALPIGPDIGTRISFARAFASGQTIMEFSPQADAAREIRNLFTFIEKGIKQ